MSVIQIVDSASLQAAAVEYLARDQDTTLIARVPTFIQLFEAKMNRTLFCRQMEDRSTTVCGAGEDEPEFVSLPADFQSMRRIRITTVTGKPRLEYLTNAQLDEFRLRHSNVTGQPRYFTIYGNEIEIAPTPDTSYTLEMVYRANLPSLNANSTNWLLALAPDAYLFGVLLESAPYIKQDARIQVWAAAVQSALIDLNALSLTSTFNAGPLQMRTSGITP